jgi:CelD/BcsL family acetyltransferase involved in cellulose biosynthesis
MEPSMETIQVDVLPGVDALLSSVDSWNDLWDRSQVLTPIARAEPTAAWVQAFAHDQRYETLVVRRGKRWLAALPLVATPWGRLVQAAGLPRNPWIEAGDLLVDPTCDLSRVLGDLAGRLATMDWPVYRFAFVRPQSVTWQALTAAMMNAGMAVDCRPMYPVAIFRTPHPSESPLPPISRNLKKKLRRAEHELQQLGTVQLTWHVPSNVPQKQSLLSRALAIEHGGWKGRQGTSVLTQPGLSHYLQRLTDYLVADRMVAFAFLELDEQPIAFEMLWRAKNALHSYKVGYDERYRAQQPGNLLIYWILRDLALHQRAELYDAVGPATDGIRRFGGQTELVARVTAAPRRLLGRALVEIYRSCWPPVTTGEYSALP